MGGNVSEGNKHGGVNGNGVVDQGSDDLLDKGNQLGRENVGGIRGFGVLDGSAIVGSLP